MASSNAPIWMTLAAAAGTLVIVGGVLGGPAVLRCANAPEGLLACLRGEIVDIGLLPQPEAPTEPKTTEVAAPEPPPAEPVPTAPDLTLVRAEPDGELLIAGTAAPGLAVQVFVNGNLLGETTAEPSGDWVLVPDAPLPPGTATITVGPADAKQPRATATVVIAPDKAAPPVVKIDGQGAPTPPAAGQPSPEPVVPAAAPEPATTPVAQSPKPPPIKPEPAPALDVAEITPPQEYPAEPKATVSEAPKPDTPKTETPNAAARPETGAPTTQTLTPDRPAVLDAPASSTVPAVEASQPRKEAELVTEPAKPVLEAPPPTKPAPTDKRPAPEPAAEATQPAKPIAPVRPVLPVAPVKPAAPVASTMAAVNEPVPPPPLQVAAAPQPASMPKETPTPVPAPPLPGPTIDAIEIDGTANFFAGAGPEGAIVELFVQDRFIATAKVEGGRWLVEARGALTLPAQRVRIELADAPAGGQSARGEVNFILDVAPKPSVNISGSGTTRAGLSATAAADLALPLQPESELEVDPAIPTLRATPPADPSMLRFSSGKAIIRRGETLWAIATRVYGDGSQYPRIVSANPDLIAHPGRIFPGQVFDLPALQGSQAAD